MAHLEYGSNRQLFLAALFAAVFASGILGAVFTAVTILDPTSSFSSVGGPVSTFLFQFFGTLVSNVVWYLPYLLVVLVTVVEPTRRTVTGGAVILYSVDFLFTWASRQALAAETTLATFAGPLTTVVQYLAIATVVWVGYHGGYERLREALGDAQQHPLFATIVDDRQLARGVSVERALLTVVPAALVGALGLLFTGAVQTRLYDLATSGPSGPSITINFGGTTAAGVRIEQLPVEFALQASFLLAVLLVTGPRFARSDVLKGIAVIVGVESTVALLPTLLPPFRTVDLWAPHGPVMAPLAAVIPFLAITAAVWLAVHDGTETLRV